MSNEATVLRPATAQDWPLLQTLLTAVDLPLEGVAEHLGRFSLVFDSEEKLLACAGFERYGSTGLLRSVAVVPERQGTGVGQQVVSAVIEQARLAGIEEIVLLTTTARDFFARRFHFTESQRAEFDERLANSPEWKLPRCSSACCLKLDLSSQEEPAACQHP